MIDENEIMPFNFFKYGGVYSAQHNGMRYQLKRTGDKPDFSLTATVWQGPFCYDATAQDKKMNCSFDYSEEGRIAAIDWIYSQYETRKSEWDSAPSILDSPIHLDYKTPETDKNKGE